MKLKIIVKLVFVILFTTSNFFSFGQNKKTCILETLNKTKFPDNMGKYASSAESIHEAQSNYATPLLFEINGYLSKKNDKFKEIVADIKSFFAAYGFKHLTTKTDIEDGLDMSATIKFDDLKIELNVEDGERDLELVFTNVLYYNWFADKFGHGTKRTEIDRLSEERKLVISYWGKEIGSSRAAESNAVAIPKLAVIPKPNTIPKPYLPPSATNNTQNVASTDVETNNYNNANCQNDFRKYSKFSTDEMPRVADFFTNKFNTEFGIYVEYVIKKMEEKNWMLDKISNPFFFGKDNYYRSKFQHLNFKKGDIIFVISIEFDMSSNSDSLLIEKSISTSGYPSKKGSEILKEFFKEDFNEYYVKNGSFNVSADDINKILMAKSLDCYKKYIDDYKFKSKNFTSYINTITDLYTIRNEETEEAYLHNAAIFNHETESSSEANRKNQKYWLDKAVEKGSGKAMLQLGQFYKKYDDIPDAVDINKAMFWFQKAADLNVIQGYYELAMIYQYGVMQIGDIKVPTKVLIKEDLEIAKDYYKKYIKAAIETKNAPIINYLSEIYKVGDAFVTKDVQEAERLKKMACDLDKKFCGN